MTALDWNPSPRKLRQFGVVALAVLTGMAVVAHLRGRSELAQWLPLGLGAVAGLLALARPTALRMVYVLLSLAVFPIGFVVSHLILLVVFYGVITPLGALARLAALRPAEPALGPDGAYLLARTPPAARQGQLPAPGVARRVTSRGRHGIPGRKDDMSTERPESGDDFAAAARAGRGSLVGEFWYYLKLYRSWLVVPVILALALLGGFVMLGGSGAAPFIYALF